MEFFEESQQIILKEFQEVFLAHFWRKPLGITPGISDKIPLEILQDFLKAA